MLVADTDEALVDGCFKQLRVDLKEGYGSKLELVGWVDDRTRPWFLLDAPDHKLFG